MYFFLKIFFFGENNECPSNSRSFLLFIFEDELKVFLFSNIYIYFFLKIFFFGENNECPSASSDLVSKKFALDKSEEFFLPRFVFENLNLKMQKEGRCRVFTSWKQKRIRSTLSCVTTCICI